MTRPTIAIALNLLLVGCTAQKPSATGATAQAPVVSEPAWLSNGLIGLRLDAMANGHGLPMFSSDEYTPTGEEKIRVIENPVQFDVNWNGERISPVTVETRRQSMDFATGELTTEFESEGLRVSARSRIDPTRRIIAQRFQFSGEGKLRLTSTLPGMKENPLDVANFGANLAPSGTEFRLLQSFSPDASWTPTLGGGTVLLNLAGTPVQLTRVVTVGTKGRDDAPKFLNADGAAKSVFDSKRAGWAQIEIEGPVEDQQAINSMVWALRSAVKLGGMSVPPMGLSSDRYFGHIFWDADVWVFPAAALLSSEAAAIPRYRLATARQASANYQEWLKAGRPTGLSPLGPLADPPTPGVKYPWESSVTGRETVPGPSKFEDHITGSVSWSLQLAAALGLADPSPVAEIANDAGRFYLARSVSGPGGVREIKGTMSPDENHIGNNDLYTNLLAERFARRINPKIRFKRPTDAQGLLTYDNDRLRAYKQAAAILAIYPLQDPEAERQAKSMIDRFAGKVIVNGPAMSDSVDAVIWARLGETEKAYAAWHRSWNGFVTGPLLLFSEKRNRPFTYFVTGAGGSLQSVLYGFMGLRIDAKPLADYAWKSPLKGGMWISARPNLPTAWNRLTIKALRLPGRTVTLTAKRVGDRVVVTDK